MDIGRTMYNGGMVACAVGTFHTNKLWSRLYSTEIEFYF